MASLALVAQREVTSPGPLLDERGGLAAPGWARRPLWRADLGAGASRVPRWRVKRWDYYGIWTPELYVSATVAHLGYAVNAFTYVVDFASGRCIENSRLAAPWTLPTPSDDPERGRLLYDDGETRLDLGAEPGRRTLSVEDRRFDGGRGLRVEAALACPPRHESVTTATPFPEGGFYYNHKLQALPASGALRWGSRATRLDPERALGQLDWGRGVWPRRSHWVWASASGFEPDGRRVGLNLGFFGDHRYASEDALLLDGRVHKLGRVRVHFDPRDHSAPWCFRDVEGRLDVRLRPTLERVARSRAPLVRSEVHQCFGLWSGRAVSDAGETLWLSGLPGFAEEHHARW